MTCSGGSWLPAPPGFHSTENDPGLVADAARPVPSSVNDAMFHQLRHWADTVRADAPPIVTNGQVRAALAAASAAQRSLELGQSVEVCCTDRGGDGVSGGERLRVGFMSGVRHAGQYGAILAADPRVEIVCMAEEPDAPDWARRHGERLARALGVPWSTDVLALCQGERIDLALICSEPVRHARLAIEALTAGVHVLVDKPVATTVPDADAVLAAADAAAGVCTVVNRTYSPAVARLWRWVDAGHLGLPRHVDVEFLASGAHFTASVERPDLVLDPALSGGGELLNFRGYAVDYIRYLTGLEIVEVYAEASTLFGAGHAAHAVEDCAVVSLGLQHGVTATATVGRIPAAPGLGAGSSTVRLIGSHGHVVADDDLPQVLRYGNGVVAHPVAAGGAEAALTAFLTDLVSHLLAGTRPRYGVADACAAVAVIDAAYRSVATGRTAVVAQGSS